MTEKPIIENARDVAEKVATIILKDSYRNGRDESGVGVRDVLLFGSALRGEPAHDIDMLAIHNLYPLNELGFATIYDEHTGRMVPHPTANIQKGFYRPSGILKSMGGEGIYDLLEMEFKIEDVGRMQISKMRVLGDQYVGTLDLPYVGEIKFAKPVPFKAVLDTVSRAVDEKLRSRMVSTKVKALMKEHGLNLDEVLDLHAMNVRLLSAGEMKDERKIVVAQCVDPKFWNTVLTTGRLYNRDSGKFEIPVDQKYEGASQLFPQ